MLQRQVDVVVAVHQTPAGVVVHFERQRHIAAGDGTVFQADGHFAARLLVQQLPQQLNGFLRHNRGQHAVLGGVAVENVGETGGNHHAETVIVQRPHGVLAGGTNAEIRAGHKDLALLVFRLVQHEFRVAAPRVEQGVVEAAFLHALQEHGRDDLVGINVGTAKRHGHAGKGSQFFHVNKSFDCLSIFDFDISITYDCVRSFRSQQVHRSAGEQMVPRMAVAAATAGDARCVREPLP